MNHFPPQGIFRRDLKLHKLTLLSYLCQHFCLKNVTTKFPINLTGSNFVISDEISDVPRNETLLTTLQYTDKKW